MILITALAFLFILGFSITIHEFGHFIFAKIFKIPVEKFSLGFGPPVIKKKIGETDFRIAWIPLGGYVKMAGEEDVDMPFQKSNVDNTPAPTPNFYDAPLLHRILVVLSGPLFNIFSGFLVLVLLYLFYGTYVNPHLRIRVEKGSYAEKVGFQDFDSLISINNTLLHSWDELEQFWESNRGNNMTFLLKRKGEIIRIEIPAMNDSLFLNPYVPPVVGSLKRDGPAYRAGMAFNDTVVKIEGDTIKIWDDFVARVRRSKNIPLHIKWLHKGELKSAIITPVPYYDPILNDTVGQIGIVMPLKKVYVTPSRAISMAARRSAELIYFTLKTFYKLIKGEISRKVLGGPIAIARLTGESARWGFESLLSLLSVISINLGLVNLFPIPALDGGHILVGVIEAIRRKRFSKKTRLIIQQIGFAIIFLLIIYVTFNDLTR
jgi:regulator of sigma E protease|uniref:Zinc metalloprotease n=1 Tax=candidate division WOR-3 bacterium TaxID=2052148 RepID=A0A7V3RH82_UNCW3